MRCLLALTMLAACGGGGESPATPDAAGPDAETSRLTVCDPGGTSSATGAGPAGSVDGHHVYASALTGFCTDELVLIVTSDDPLAAPYLEGTAVIRATLPKGTIGGTAPWSGTFDATIALSDETSPATGTIVVDEATAGFERPTRVRATATIADGAWDLTATVDAPYCYVDTCL